MSDKLQFVADCYRNFVESNDKLDERLIELDDSDLALSLTRCEVLYREAVTTSSPTLPLGGYVGVRSRKRRLNPVVGLCPLRGPQSQGSRAARQPWAGLLNRFAVLAVRRILNLIRSSFRLSRATRCSASTSSSLSD
jgi:hypothetical protein